MEEVKKVVLNQNVVEEEIQAVSEHQNVVIQKTADNGQDTSKDVEVDIFSEDPLEDIDIDFLLEEVENKIAPLALA